MAGRTVGGGKRGARRGVHGIVRLLPGRQMALRIAAIGCGNRQTVVVVDVAKTASDIRMSVSQRKSGRAVIEDSRRPGSDWVAGCAGRCGCRETGRDVI